ncbi:right-handed parallel beta-helix repeat-containing protein [bacterium]|nr:right-handed parallel beta-helix repeat-containing protein [bacterium]
MKHSTLILHCVIFTGALFMSAYVNGATYYAASDGNNGATGKGAASPFQTLGHAASQLVSGDTLLLRRGDVFRESVSMPAGVHVGAYGDEGLDLPVIAGSVPITGWSVYTGSIYVADTIYTAGYLYVNNALMTIARYPNTGWLRTTTWTENSAGGATVIQTGSLASHPRNANGYWTNAWIRWHRHSWWFETRKVTNYLATGHLALDSKSIIAIQPYYKNGWGFYLDNKLEEIDAPGEWFFSPSAKKIYLYPPGGVNPTGLLVEASVLNTGMSISGGSVSNICFRHFKDWALSLSGAPVVRGCRFEYNGRDSDATEQAGGTAMRATWGVHDAVISGNMFISNLNCSINWNENPGQVSATLIEDNTILHSGTVDGYGGSGPWHASAIIISNAKNLSIRRNRIFGAGYCGVIVGKDYNIVERNFITNIMVTLNDGGGVYCNASYNYIRNNVILYSVGGMESSGPWANLGQGIWPEFLADFHHSEIVSNTVAHCGSWGIFLENNFNCLIRDNNLFESKRSQLLLDGKETNPDVGRYTNLPQNNVIINNVLYGTNAAHQVLWFDTNFHYGVMYSNYYCNAFTDSVIGERTGSSGTGRTIPYWQGKYSWADAYARTDVNKTDRQGELCYNASDTTATFAVNGVCRELDGGIAFGTFTLAPYWSRIMTRLSSNPPNVTVSAAVQGSATAETGRAVSFVTHCPSGGVAEIGFGSQADGADWLWRPLGPASAAPNASATGEFWATAGSYYFAARWRVPMYGGTAVFYGVSSGGETDRASLGTATASFVVTNTPMYSAVWEFIMPNSTAPDKWTVPAALFIGEGLSSNCPGGGLMTVSGFPASSTGMPARHVIFSASTLGRDGIGWYLKARSKDMGPRSVDLEYSADGVGGPWLPMASCLPLDTTSTWQFIGGMINDPALGNSASSAFRLIAYSCSGGPLDLGAVEIGALTPEPSAALAVLAAAAMCLRRPNLLRERRRNGSESRA